MNILFICTGNTCRSPMAERYLDSLNLPNVTAESRGLSAEGGGVNPNAVKVMGELGIDLSHDVSVQLTAKDLIWADKILYMSPSHLTVLSLYAPKEKLFMLGGGISDPYGGDTERYRKCRDEIISAIDRLAAEDFFTEALIFRAEEKDIEDIENIEKECFSTPWSQTAIKDAMENNTAFFIAKKGKKTVGYIGISAVLDEGYITNVAVSQKERRKGIGTALLNRVFSFARDNNLSFVSLEVRVSNQNAISLYTALGFKEEGKRKNFYDKPKEDALILTKRF